MKTLYSTKALFLTVVAFVALCSSAHNSFGQQVIYGNEWINFSQKYYKIKVPATGLYRLDNTYLQAAGINGIDPRRFQLFRRGKEVAIYVSGETDGSFDSGDFIEFYGEQNDGELDKELYKNPDQQVNPFYSLYTDTAAYFLTWSAASPGKRMITQNPSSAGLIPELWHWQTQRLQLTDQYNRGKRYGENYMSWGDEGEGYLSTAFNSTNPRNVQINGIQNVYTQGPKPTAEVALVGSNATAPDVDIYAVNGSSSIYLGNMQFSVYGSKKQIFTLELSDIASNGSVTIRVVPKNTSLVRVSYIAIRYPQRPILSSPSLSFSPATTSAEPLYYMFDGSAAGNATAYDITSSDNIYRIPGTTNGAQKGFVFPSQSASDTRKGFLWSGTPLTPSGPAKEVIFRSLAASNATYLIVSHKNLMLSAGASTNPVEEYAAYRASAAGGGHTPLVLEVEQLYDQFFYGDKSSAAIRRFMKFMMVNGTPQYLFLLGKGLEADNVTARKTPNNLAVKDLVPTGGTPGSDVFFTADWETDNYMPKVATGRVPANTPQDVLRYLTKVRQHESLPDNLDWRKNILHLVGGTGNEQKGFLSYMRSYERIAEAEWLGANVLTNIRSATGGGLETINIARELNAGLSLITFFGHSSSTVSDLDIGRVSDVVNGYRNEGKYPMLLMNGCNAGNIFTSNRSFGEDWLLTEEKGAIAFLAHVSYGYPSLLNLFSSNLYLTAFGSNEYLSESVGKQHQKAIELTAAMLKGDNAIAMHMQMLLQSDPALHVIGPKKADYTVPSGGVVLKSVDGTKVTANSDKFLLSIDIRNLGKVNKDDFFVSVNRKLENGAELLYGPFKISPVYYRDTIQIELEARTTEAAGMNTFEIRVDPANAIDELDETNNVETIEYFFSRSGVLAIGPREYSIVKEEKVKLIGQSTDLLTAPRGYYFELDTVHTFTSSWKKTNVVRADLMPVWEVTLPPITTMRDSMVYFWRVRYEIIGSEEDTIWASSSFRYIPGSNTGWSQRGLGQLQKAEKNKLIEQPQSNTFSFSPIYRIFELKGVGGGGTFGYPPYGIFLDNFKTIEANCAGSIGAANMMAIVLNDKTLEPFTGIGMPGEFGDICGTDPKFVYHFGNLTTPRDRTRLENFLKAIPEGYHVAMLSMYNVPFSTMPESLKAAFRSIGSSLIDNLQTGDPFGIIGRKGAPSGTAMEVGPVETDLTPRNRQTIRLEGQVSSFASQGILTSSIIGPAKEWSSLHHAMNLEAADRYRLAVIGIKNDNTETVLFPDVKAATYDISSVNAAQYPYLKLKLTLTDELQRTPPQLKQWSVLYQEVPEGLIRPDLVGLAKYQTISEQATNGKVDLQYAFHNISATDFSDSITVEATVLKQNGNKITKLFKVEALQKGDTVFFNHHFFTVGMQGENRLRIKVNPRDLPNRVLPEQNYLNNVLEIPFTVGVITAMPPVLDVVFDGSRILDGDIVAPSPLISIVLKDNARIIPITEPTAMRIYLKKPGADFEEIAVSNHPDVKWFPGNAEKDFRIEFQPKGLANGDYTLEVQGEDLLEQKAGTDRYRINFKVENEASISNFYPYPNPFSSKTRFVFTLTGSSIPERMKIQIMTVTGKVIKEIQREELGAIKIGNNITEYAWDGTDEFGDRLANGIYLYRVVLDNGIEEMKHHSTAGDKAFKKGYGKLYILR